MTTYLIIQTIVLAVAAGLFVYADSFRRSGSNTWIDRKDLCMGIGFSILGIFIMDVLAIVVYYETNW